VHRISWARARQRVFDIDVQHRPNRRAGKPKMIATIH
jgi:hypothetical protein